MPRPNNKRKAGEIDFDDPMSFVADYCRRNGLPQEAGGSSAEKECAKLATDAREDYKEKQDAAANSSASPTPGSVGLSLTSDPSRQTTSNSRTKNDGPLPEEKNDRRGLSPAQKYSIRLQNNRKSAYASKVYSEVLKRELSFRLQKLDQKECSTCCAKEEAEKGHLKRIEAMEKEIQSLKTQLEAERLRSSEHQTRNEELNEQIKELTEKWRKNESVETKDTDKSVFDINGESPPAIQSINVSSPLEQFAESNRTIEVSSMPLESPTRKGPDISPQRTDTKGFTSFQQDSQLSLVKVESQGTLPPSQSQSFHHRLMNSRALQTISFPTIDSEAKDFHANLTCTQSQNDDVEDKGQLLRNLPVSGGIPVGLTCSQPSQSEMGAAFKSSLGSEDLQMGEPDLFLSSQGTIGSLTKAT